MAQPIVLFSGLEPRTIREMLPLARRFRDEGNYNTTFLLSEVDTSVSQPLLDEGFSIIDVQTSVLTTAHTSGSTQQPSPYTPPPSRWRLISSNFARLHKQLRRFRHIFSYYDICLFFVEGDRVAQTQVIPIKAANEAGVPSLIVPFAISFPWGPATVRMRSKHFKKLYDASTGIRRLAGLLFPRYVFHFRGKPVLYQSPMQIGVMWIMGLLPRYPWTLGGGNSTHMFIESQQALKICTDLGVQKEKCTIAGRPIFDDLHHCLQSDHIASLREELQLDADKKVILCSVPQVAEHNLLSWDDHWKATEDLLKGLQTEGAHVILNLHPRSKQEDYQELADTYGARIVMEPYYKLLPLADVFVATYSSLVAQALALGIPSVVVDYYDFEYPIYTNTAGVRIIRDPDLLGPELHQLCTSDAYYTERCEGIPDETWAIIDGKSIDRIMEGIERILR